MKIKKLIIILTILAIIISCIILILLNSQNKLSENLVTPPATENVQTVIKDTLQRENVRNNFYTIKSCIEKFYTSYSDIFDNKDDNLLENENTEENILEKKLKKVYNMLDSEYLEYKKINLNNLETILPKIGEVKVIIRDMYVIQKDEKISAYFVYGKLVDNSTAEVSNFSILVKADMSNRTFKVLLQDYIDDKYKNVNTNNLDMNFPTEIEKNNDNIFKYQIISEQQYINDLFLNYQNNLKYDEDYIYSKLDEEYKTIRFNEKNEFIAYKNENRLRLLIATLSEYKATKKEKYKEYLCKDNKGNYYIFKETAPFQYTVQLDNYTIPTEDFKETYNKASNAQKVVLNIKKFFMGIDDKNYGYSYNLLSESFKQNKYQAKNDFVSYVKQNFFEKNEIEYISYEEKNGVYIYKINLKDATGKNAEQKAFNMIVKLKNGTDFEMSFGTN